jgi:hypothetical protein
MVAWVPWGHAGYATPVDERDYQVGMGSQGLISLRASWGTRVTVSSSLRAFHILDLGGSARFEDIRNAQLAAQVRIRGPHALGLVSEWSKRRAHEEVGALDQSGWTLSARYTFLSGW